MSYCKYPPAKPGALELEPLEAAGKSIMHAILPIQRLPTGIASLGNHAGNSAF
jgi:hypothetical protein